MEKDSLLPKTHNYDTIGFRVRPSFNELINKDNSELNVKVNPIEVVLDSFEYSNLINNN